MDYLNLLNSIPVKDAHLLRIYENLEKQLEKYHFIVNVTLLGQKEHALLQKYGWLLDAESAMSRVHSIQRSPLVLAGKVDAMDYLIMVQKYLETLGYNHTGTQFYPVNKKAQTYQLLNTAKNIVKHGLPIKCLEAVIVAIYLTNPIPSIIRVPISFKTCNNEKSYRHIVLLTGLEGKWGVAGLSRCKQLMNKPCNFKSINDIIHTFKEEYEKINHSIISIKLGLPIAHDSNSGEFVTWKYAVMQFSKLPWKAVPEIMRRYEKEIKSRTKNSSVQEGIEKMEKFIRSLVT